VQGLRCMAQFVIINSVKCCQFIVMPQLAARSFILSAYIKQEAQLSQRDRALLRVIEYFAKSLRVTQGHSN